MLKLALGASEVDADLAELPENMPIPSVESLLSPVLYFAADEAQHSTPDLQKRIAECLKLTYEEISQKHRNGVSIFANRVAFALVWLMRAGALKRMQGEVYQITATGKEFLGKHPEGITIPILTRLPHFVPFGKGRPVAIRPGKLGASQNWEEPLATSSAAKLELPEGIKIGSIVLVTWPASEAEKVEAGTFEGRVVKFDCARVTVDFIYELGSDRLREQIVIDLLKGIDHMYHATVSEIELKVAGRTEE